MGQHDLPRGVGRTAIGMALVRATESSRPDRLFDDPYASAFTAAAAGALPGDSPGGSHDAMAGIVHAAVIRTRFYDDFLIAASRVGCRQVVLVAAGLDTRAFRLSWPQDVRVFEIDLPDVLTFKQRVLAEYGAQPRCRRVTVGLDLREDWSAGLAEAGFEPSRRTVWLIEGLLTYLTAAEASTLLQTVSRQSADGSQLACEHQEATLGLSHPGATGGRLAQFTAMWKGGLGASTPRWLTEHGWGVQLQDRATVADHYERPATTPSSGGFITATLSAATYSMGAGRRPAG